MRQRTREYHQELIQIIGREWPEKFLLPVPSGCPGILSPNRLEKSCPQSWRCRTIRSASSLPKNLFDLLLTHEIWRWRRFKRVQQFTGSLQWPLTQSLLDKEQGMFLTTSPVPFGFPIQDLNKIVFYFPNQNLLHIKMTTCFVPLSRHFSVPDADLGHLAGQFQGTSLGQIDGTKPGTI